MTNMTNNNRARQKANGQVADAPDYLHLFSLFSTFHISKRTLANTSKKGMKSLPPELFMKITSYFYDDYTYCKLTDDIWIEATNQSTTSAAATPAIISAPAFYLICPYAALAVTDRYLWTVIARMLRRRIPLEIIEEDEAFLRVGRGETGDHWARKYGRYMNGTRHADKTCLAAQVLADPQTNLGLAAEDRDLNAQACDQQAMDSHK